jgi:hypothetical protein
MIFFSKTQLTKHEWNVDATQPRRNPGRLLFQRGEGASFLAANDPGAHHRRPATHDVNYALSARNRRTIVSTSRNTRWRLSARAPVDDTSNGAIQDVSSTNQTDDFAEGSQPVSSEEGRAINNEQQNIR